MIQFEISALDETLTEGESYSFTVTPKAALSGAMEIRWVIVPKGKIPITKNDFSALEGSASFASGATAAQTITITPTDDDRPEVSGEFELQVYQVGADGNDILLASQDVTLTDDEDFSGVSPSVLVGSGTDNNFFFGSSNPLSSAGLNGDDAYVISRYQTGDVDLGDSFGANIIKLDYGVDISSARKTGFGAGKGELLLGTDAANPTGTFKWNGPAGTDAYGWQYQLGDGALLSWAEFLAELGLSGDGGALSTPYRVASFASDSEAEGNEFNSVLVGAKADEVFAFGGDGERSSAGLNGDDIYIITRYQTGDATLSDGFGTNIIKLDFGVDISSARKTGRSAGKGELLLGTDASAPTATLKWNGPAVTDSWQYQIGDGAVLSWTEFLEKLGPSDGDGKLANSYTVGFLPIITTIGDDTLMVEMGERIDVTTIVAIDGDGDDLTFSLSGADAALFEIDASGELRFRAKPDTDGKYELMVYVTDGSYDASGNPRGATEDTFEHRDAGRTFKYTGGELSKTDVGAVSVAAGTITKVGGATFNFSAQTGLNVEGEVDSYIIVDDDDSDGTYEARRVEELPTGDDYYALGNVVSNTLTTYGYDYNDMINVQVDVSITDIA